MGLEFTLTTNTDTSTRFALRDGGYTIGSARSSNGMTTYDGVMSTSVTPSAYISSTKEMTYGAIADQSQTPIGKDQPSILKAWASYTGTQFDKQFSYFTPQQRQEYKGFVGETLKAIDKYENNVKADPNNEKTARADFQQTIDGIAKRAGSLSTIGGPGIVTSGNPGAAQNLQPGQRLFTDQQIVSGAPAEAGLWNPFHDKLSAEVLRSAAEAGASLKVAANNSLSDPGQMRISPSPAVNPAVLAEATQVTV